MSPSKASQYISLGIAVEYLRGITSASFVQAASLVEFPDLQANLTRERYSGMNVAGALQSLHRLLRDLNLPKTLAVAAGFRPQQDQLEEFIAKSPTPEQVWLIDPFADQLVAIAHDVAASLRQELTDAI